ncbi:Hypothetical predicted protein [Paramuricea clavata]|uniref:Uncharacterized protein n=1 Tax=Paramuricea clavata TaxID=317549 RepID=A0A6S7IX32_PARCT|nr:Hypothetical predicted protein [Paramuricea clavata]
MSIYSAMILEKMVPQVIRLTNSILRLFHILQHRQEHTAECQQPFAPAPPVLTHPYPSMVMPTTDVSNFVGSSNQYQSQQFGLSSMSSSATTGSNISTNQAVSQMSNPNQGHSEAFASDLRGYENLQEILISVKI